MAVSIVLLILCAIVLLFMVPRSRYGLPLFFIVLGLILSIASILLQYYSSPNYSSPILSGIRNVDVMIYRYIGSMIRVAMPYLQILKNLGIIAYLYGTVVFLDVIKRNHRLEGQKNRKTLNVSLRIFTYIFLVSYFLFYSPNNAYGIYRHFYLLPVDRRAGYVRFITMMHKGFSILVAFYIFYPMIHLIIHYLRKEITCFTNTILIICGCLSYINLHFYITFFAGVFKNNVSDVFSTGFWFFNRITKIPNVYILIFPLFSLTLLGFVVVNINKFFSSDLLSFSQQRTLKKSIEDLNQNLKDVFHSEKNLMFSIQILANEVKNEYGTEAGMAKLERIIEISTEQMSTISESLNRIKELHIHTNPVDLRTVTDSALKNVTIPEGVTIKKNYCSFPAMCRVDSYHTSQAIVNLIMNSLDALAMSETENKEIEISIDASKEWVFFAIKDNGTGMEKKSIKKMLMPFVSTKSKTGNWGIGLSYVFRVITAQLGQLKIRSSVRKSNHYTCVEILFPRNRRQEHE